MTGGRYPTKARTQTPSRYARRAPAAVALSVPVPSAAFTVILHNGEVLTGTIAHNGKSFTRDEFVDWAIQYSRRQPTGYTADHITVDGQAVALVDIQAVQ